MGEEPLEEPNVSIKPPVDVTLRSVDQGVESIPEGPAPAPGPELGGEESQPELDVRIKGNPEAPAEGLVSEDPVARATREAREQQGDQPEAEPDDIGAVALTPHQVELQEHDANAEHTRGNKDLAYYVAHATDASEMMIKNLEKMDMPDDIKSQRIHNLRSNIERAAATELEKNIKQRNITSMMFDRVTQSIHEFATGDREANIIEATKTKDDEFVFGRGTDNISPAVMEGFIKDVVQITGGDPSLVKIVGERPSKQDLDRYGSRKIVLPSTLDGFDLEVNLNYGVDDHVTADQLLPESFTLKLVKSNNESSKPEASPDDSVSQDATETDLGGGVGDH